MPAWSLVMDEVSRYEPDWVYFFAKLGKGIDRGCIQHQLSLGVTRMRRLIEAKTYNARQELLSDKYNKGRNTHFLEAALERANDPVFGNQLSKFGSEDERAFITTPLITDPDPGPDAVWRWAHQSERPELFSFSPSQIPLRKMAYVMWDMKRLEATKLFEHQWDGLNRYEVYYNEHRRRVIDQTRLEKTANSFARQGK